MIEFGQSSSDGGSSSNVIVQKVKIADFNVTYGQKREWQQYSDDIGIDLVLDVGQDFQPTMYIGGSFKLDEMNDTIVGWGRAFKVKMFFDAIGMPIKLAKGSSVSENRLPENAKELIIGKDFLRLSYVSTKKKADGSNRWKDWQDTAKIGQEENLKAQFNKSVTDGYVKDFQRPGESDVDWDEPTYTEENIPL